MSTLSIALAIFAAIGSHFAAYHLGAHRTAGKLLKMMDDWPTRTP